MDQQADSTAASAPSASQRHSPDGPASSPPTPTIQGLHISGSGRMNAFSAFDGAQEPISERFRVATDRTILNLHPNPQWPPSSTVFDEVPRFFPQPSRTAGSTPTPVPRRGQAIRSHGGSPTTQRRRRSKEARRALQPYRSAPVSPTGGSTPNMPLDFDRILRQRDVRYHINTGVSDVLKAAAAGFKREEPTVLAIVDSPTFSFLGPPTLPNLDPSDRIKCIATGIRSSFSEHCQDLHLCPATDDLLLLCHTPEHVARFGNTTTPTGPSAYDKHLTGYSRQPLRVDTPANAAYAARLSCGAVVDAGVAVAGGKCANAFVATRPAGHMAHAQDARGYCLFNNVAVAAKAALKRPNVDRVMIVDISHRHPSGTSELFHDSRDVLVLSLHRHDDGAFFPGTGPIADVGSGDAKGKNVNIAWQPSSEGMGDAEYLAAFRTIVLPMAMEFCPDIIFVSAGFDGCAYANLPPSHGGFCLSPSLYAYMVRMLSTVACGKIVVALEGSADPTSSTMCANKCIGALLGDALDLITGLHEVPNDECVATLNKVREAHAPYWRCMGDDLDLAGTAAFKFFSFDAKHQDTQGRFVPPQKPLRVRHSTSVPRPPGDGMPTPPSALSAASLDASQGTTVQWQGVSASMIQQEAEERLGNLSEDDLSAVVNLTAMRYSVRAGSASDTPATATTPHPPTGCE